MSQVLRIRCYVSVITEKYDLSFQLTYHTLAFNFQTTNAEEQAPFDMSKIQQTVVLDLQTSIFFISALPTIDQLISKSFLLKTKRYCIRKIPFIGENSRWVNARLRLQQSRIRRIHVADLAFHNCFGNFWKVEKYDIRAVDKKMQTERNKAKQRQYRGQRTQGSNSLFRN